MLLEQMNEIVEHFEWVTNMKKKSKFMNFWEGNQ